MDSNENTFYIRVVAINEIYNFVVLSFYIRGRYDAQENNIKLQKHIRVKTLYYFLEHLNNFKYKNSKL
jgi:hypothetical protein